MQPPALTRSHAELPLALHDLVVGSTSPGSFEEFRAADGALVDLRSLQAIADAPERVIEAYLKELSPSDTNLVLSGLELQGAPLVWTVEVRQEEKRTLLEIQSRGLVKPGREFQVGDGWASLMDASGMRHLVRVEKPLALAAPPAAKDTALVLEIERTPTTTTGKKSASPAAREAVRPRLLAVPADQARQPRYLPLAIAVDGGQVWATDIQRLCQPEDPLVEHMLKLIEYLENVVWDSDRHGRAWQNRILGREWDRYPTTATLALQATRTALMTHVSTTMDRIRLLRNLHAQLRRSIENAEESLVKWLGRAEGVDPYRTVVPIDVEIRGPAGRPPPTLAQHVQDIFGDFAIRDRGKSQITVSIHAPLNLAERALLIGYFREMSDELRSQSEKNEDVASPDDVQVQPQGGKALPLSQPEAIVDQLSSLTGWEAK